jgi:mannose-1-phosphate guanylyltransferase / mannose-6-phosphate isomerase
VLGLQDVVVVATRDAVLVTSKAESQSVKDVVAKFEKAGREEVINHQRVHRPWGWYERLALGDRFQVKCIMVSPGSTLSLQSHFHRSEHWVVVKGAMEVTKDGEVIVLAENQSTFVPVGSRHRMRNPGKIPAFLIEVQSGGYLGEDDIVRYEDVYGRVEK